MRLTNDYSKCVSVYLSKKVVRDYYQKVIVMHNSTVLPSRCNPQKCVIPPSFAKGANNIIFLVFHLSVREEEC